MCRDVSELHTGLADVKRQSAMLYSEGYYRSDRGRSRDTSLALCVARCRLGRSLFISFKVSLLPIGDDFICSHA